MGPLDVLDHLLNFVAPAAFMALALPLAGRWVGAAGRMGWWRLALLQFGCACAVLVGGLLVFGHDGKMATYAALVLVAATVQWLAARAWRR